MKKIVILSLLLLFVVISAMAQKSYYSFKSNQYRGYPVTGKILSKDWSIWDSGYQTILVNQDTVRVFYLSPIEFRAAKDTGYVSLPNCVKATQKKLFVKSK